jgi:hypothetical protein
MLHVITADALDGEPAYTACLATLDTLVPAGRSHVASERCQWRDRNALAIAHINAGIDIRPGQQYQPDLDKLRALTASNLTLLAPATTLPVAEGLHLPRLSADLDRTTFATGSVLISATPGRAKPASRSSWLVSGRAARTWYCCRRATSLAAAPAVP